MTIESSRRALMIAGALGALGAAAGATPATAKGKTDAEKANIEKVKTFLDAFAKTGSDIDAICKASFNDDASVRFDALHMPGVIGPLAAAYQAKATTPKGAVFEFKYRETLAKGAVVVMVRTDTMKVPDAPDHVFEVVGVYVFKNGKMQEYADYFEV